MQLFRRIVFITALINGLALAASAQGTGSISGHVSVNGNPARGVPVILLYDGQDKNDEPRSFAEIVSRIKRITTGEDGSFRLDNLAAGRYQIATLAPSMVGAPPPLPAQKTDATDNKPENDEAESSGVSASNSDPTNRTINLRDGESVEDVNFTLVRGGVITGRVTYEDGSPAIGIAVQVTDAQGNGRTITGMNLEFDSAPICTDDRGIYRVYGLPDGHYKVSAGGQRGENTQQMSANRYRQRTYHPNVMDAASATVIEIAKGNEVRDVDIKFGEPLKSYTVTGRVIEADTGKPVPNVPVFFTSQNPGEGPQANNYAVANARGEFKFEGVPSGKYTIASPRNTQDADAMTLGNEYYSPFSKFEVREGDVRGVVVKLQRGLVITGSIIFESGGDVLSQSPNLKIYAGVQSLQPNPEEGPVTTGGFARVNADGSFILRGLSPGKASFSLNSADNDASRFQITHIEANNVVDGQYVILEKSDSPTSIRIFAASANCSVKGQVRVEGPLPNNTEISVYARRVSGANTQSGNPDEDSESEATPDANGNFVLTGLLAGPYEIIAEVIVGHTGDGKPVIRQARQIVTATPGPGAQVMLVLDVRGKAGDR